MADETDNAINAFDRDDRNLRWIEYRGSIKWLRLKVAALKRANNICEECGAKKRLEMHHLKYPQDPDKDSLENVKILCHNCHREEGGFL